MSAAARGKLRIAFLLSGSGTTLENQCAMMAEGGLPALVVLVLAARPGAQRVERARRRGIATAVVDRRAWRDPAAFGSAVEAALRPAARDLVAMVGFLSLWRVPAVLRGRLM